MIFFLDCEIENIGLGNVTKPEFFTKSKITSLLLNIQSNSVITNTPGPSIFVRYNRETL